jgi:Peptidase family C25
MQWKWVLVAIALLFFAESAGADPPQPRWIAVTAPEFRTAIEPLCAHRKAQGFQVVIVETNAVLSPAEIRAGDGRKLRERVNQVCRESKEPTYVLLVGAAGAGRQAEDTTSVVPPLAGTTGRMKGQPSDNGYGCLGKSLLPDVAVGRLPARNEAEACVMVQRTIAYETDERPGPWRRQLTILAGLPGFSPTLDNLVEQMALAQLGRIDLSWTGRVIYHQEQSRFCLPEGDLHDRARRYVEAGQALTLYLGHSNASGFYGGQARYLDREDWATLKIARGPGIFVTFGCNACQLRGADGEGYGLAAIRNPHGPVAVIGAHTICFAAMNELAARGFCDSLLGPEPPERLGACWLRMLKSLATSALPIYFPLLDRADGDPGISAPVQRLEHLEMFMLLGDPALKLPTLPRDVKLSITGQVGPGASLTVTGRLPPRLAGGKVSLSVERPTTSQPGDLLPLPKQPGPARDRIMRENHDRANDFVLARVTPQAADAIFTAHLQLPQKLPWSRLTVRAYVSTERQEGLGIDVLQVK